MRRHAPSREQAGPSPAPRESRGQTPPAGRMTRSRRYHSSGRPSASPSCPDEKRRASRPATYWRATLTGRNSPSAPDPNREKRWRFACASCASPPQEAPPAPSMKSGAPAGESPDIRQGSRSEASSSPSPVRSSPRPGGNSPCPRRGECESAWTDRGDTFRARASSRNRKRRSS